MKNIKRTMALLLVVCMVMTWFLSEGSLVTHADTYDPYVFILGPDPDTVPGYYQTYAKPFVGWSPFQVGYYGICRFFNLTNVNEIQLQKPDGYDDLPVMEKLHASTQAVCADRGIAYHFEHRYRRLPLEESHFAKSGTAAALNKAKKVRAILRHGFPYIEEPEVIQAAVNAYFGSEKVTDLTNEELMSAIQAAVWQFTNDLFGEDAPYAWWADYEDAGNAAAYGYELSQCISTEYPLDVYAEERKGISGNNINRVYEYLINLPGEEANEILIDENALALEKVFLEGNGNSYSLTMYVQIDGTVDGDDELVLNAKCGNKTKTLAIGENGTLGTDGLFPITLTGVSKTDCANVELELTGSQTVDDAVFFEAEPTGGEDAKASSQGFASLGTSTGPVYATSVVNALEDTRQLEIIKVDDQSGNPLSGVGFDLYMKRNGNDLKIGSYVTDADGKITVTVSDDTSEYYFVETQALDGYEAIGGSVTGGNVLNSWTAGSLEVSKRLINTTPAQINESFDFKLTLDLSTAPITGNSIPWLTDEYLMNQLVCSKELNWSVTGARELTATFTLIADETIIIDSIPLGTAYTLEEIMTKEDREWFQVTTKVDKQAAKNGNTAVGTIAAKNAVLFTNSVITGEVKLGDLEVSKKLINTTPAQVGETFNFKITLDLSTADAYTNAAPWMNDEYLLGKISCDEALTWAEKDGKYTAEFTVDADETVTISNIAQGTTYTVEEVFEGEKSEWFIVTTKVDDEAKQLSNLADGTIAEKNAVIFTNTVVTADVNLGDLNVSKKLINTTPAQVGETFNFKITLDLSTAGVYTDPVFWMNDEYLLGKISCDEALTWAEKDGKYTATFTVDAEETVVIKGIAYGATYTVEEVLSAEDRQWFTVTSKVGNEPTKNSTTAEGSIAQVNAVLFTNTVVTGDALRLGDLEVSKKLINTTPAVVGETFNFKITLDLSTADAYTNAAPWMNDEYLLDKISCDEALTWAEKDGKYTATFTVDAEETVVIKGIAYGATYTVEEVLSAEQRNMFTVTSQINGEAVKDSLKAQSAVALSNTVVFTNSVVTGPELKSAALSVSKELINTTPAVVGETFKFKITLDLSTADVYTDPVFWMNDEYLLDKISCDEVLNWAEKNDAYTAEFTLDAGETVTFDGIAMGTSYTVEEVLTEADREWFSVTSLVGEEAPVEGNVARSTLARNNALIFTNIVNAGPELKLGELSVSKKLINTTPAVVGETFNFKLTLDLSTADVYTDPAPWMNDQYLQGKITSNEALIWAEQDGKYITEFTVDADETVTIGGIPYGTSYTVEEVLTGEDREWFESNAQIGDTPVEGSSASGTVAQRNAVIFTNSVITGPVLETGSVEVSKKLINTTPAVVGESFNFKITLDLSTADVYVDAAPWMNDAYLMNFVTGTEDLVWTEQDGKYTAEFTVNVDETFAISGIAKGTTYTVDEIQTEEDRQWFTVTTQIGGEEAVDGTVAEGTVAQRNAVIFTNSVVTGPELKLGELEVSKKLINASAAKEGEYFDFSITVDFSSADVCQNPAPWMNNDYLIRQVKGSKELTWTKSGINTYTAAFTLKADEAITIEGLAQGSSYMLQEKLTKADRNVYRVTTQITTDGIVAVENKSSMACGNIAAENAVCFTNEYVLKDTPVTGDFGIGLPALIFMLAMLCVVILLLNRRRFI